MLEPLYAAYRALQAARDQREPLDLDLPERKILLKADGTVDRVITPARLDFHRLIEEFMILANVAAAETLERARVPLVYRVHDEPSLEKVQALREFLASIDISLAEGRRAASPRCSIAFSRASRTREYEKLVNEVVLRTPGAGRVCRRELRAFRPCAAALCPFHLADPPLRRPHRPSRPHPRDEARRPAACPTARM